MPEIKKEELMNPGFNDAGSVVLTGGGTIHGTSDPRVIVNSPRPIRDGEVLYDIDGCLVNARGDIVGYR